MDSSPDENACTIEYTNNKLEKPEKQLTNEVSNVSNNAKDAQCAGGKTATTVGGKHAGERKVSIGSEEKIKLEATDVEITELLGSVTTQNCPGTRTSARVIQKMKQDQSRPITPPINERELKKDEKSVQKTPSHMRANKPTWSNLERNHFFDALNEFGKDFESIANYISAKLKRKSSTEASFKTKDQVRQHYYQTYHKISKYVKFSDEIKKPAQELYALINYGKMRRKLQFVTDKHFMKLRSLVYQGHITVRCKGKNIRIKTPSCKALRRLNQLDDSLEDIRLPSKIEVFVSPANMEAFGRVQTVAQNPRVRTTVPLHKKLVNFIKTFQYKWRNADTKLAEEEAKLFSLQGEIDSPEKPNLTAHQEPEMCFLPKPDVTIHRPLLSITEHLSSVNISLSSYEERMGVKVRGETLNLERVASKRQRTESGSEKRSPDVKKHKLTSVNAYEKVEIPSELSSSIVKEDSVVTHETDNPQIKSESSGDELSDEINELLSDSDLLAKEEFLNQTEGSKLENISNGITAPTTSNAHCSAARSKRGTNTNKSVRHTLTFKPLISDDVQQRIRKGWTISNAADITMGDLYVVLGQDTKLELQYYWNEVPNVAGAHANIEPLEATTLFTQKQNGMPYNPTECDDPGLVKSLATSAMSNKLKHLLLIANLSERIRKRQCSCGHTCIATKTRIERDFAAKTFVSNKTFFSSRCTDGSPLFRQPIVPQRRPFCNIDPVKQLTTLTGQKLSRQVLVQRLLLQPGGNHNPLDMQEHSFDGANQSIESTQNTNDLGSNDSTAVASEDDTVTNPATTLFNNAAPPQPIESSSSDLCEFDGATPATTIPFSITGQLANSDRKSMDLVLPSSSSTPLPDENAFDDCSNASLFNGLGPMNLLRDSTSNSRWLEDNLNDFSLTSLLGHLDEINGSRDILDPSSNLSVISESSVDYMHKFQEITALMQSQDKD